jgi:hypothetical protein
MTVLDAPAVAVAEPLARRSWPVRPLPFHTLLLGAYPVLFLFAENLAEVQLRDVIPPLGRGVILAATLLLGAALALRDLRRGALVASALLVAWYGYGHVAGLLGTDTGRDAQLIGWALFLAIALAAAVVLRERPLRALTTLLDVVTVVLVVLTLVRIVPFEVSRGALAAQEASRGSVADRPAAAPGSRDVWFLVFDRYGSESSLRALGGFGNDLPDWLEVRGFHVARQAHANYGRTTMSLAATLNLRYLDDVVAAQGPDSRDGAPVAELLQDHAVGRFFQERG